MPEKKRNASAKKTRGSKLQNAPAILPSPIVDASCRAGQGVFAAIKNAREKRDDAVARAVSEILNRVRKHGDNALFAYTEQFDKVKLTPSKVRVSTEYLEKRASLTDAKLRKAIRESAKRIRMFHSRQGLARFSLKTRDSELAQIIRPLNRVGVYVPGGYTSYPSSVLMNVIPAQIAGVAEIAVVTPPRGDINPAVAYALVHLKVHEVYRVGGAQAIGALAYGTKSIKAVDKIVGPGNSYVAAAKRLVYGAVDIDSIAGPSEVVIIADKSAPPRMVALDLLAQAEHGSGDEFAICITESKTVAEKIANALEVEIKKSPVYDTLKKLPRYAITIFVTPSRRESMELSNSIAPEHLQIMTASASDDLKLVTNAAAIFLGMDTPVAMGDYFIGTNHVLPTGGAARYASPLGVESFQKRLSVAKISRAGLRNVGAHISNFARAENFVHHAMSVEERCKLI